MGNSVFTSILPTVLTDVIDDTGVMNNSNEINVIYYPKLRTNSKAAKV